MKAVYIVIICIVLWIFILKPSSNTQTVTTLVDKKRKTNCKATVEKFEEKSNISEYKQLAEQLNSANIRFYGAHWCGACKAQMELCKEAGLVLDDIFFDVDKYGEKAKKHKAEAIPHWVELDENDEVISSQTGVQQLSDLASWCKEAKKKTGKKEVSGGNSEDLNSLLKKYNIRFYGAEWCGACNMQKDLLKDNNISLDDVYYDIDKYKDHGEKYGIGAYPTWIKVSSKEEKLDEKVGVQQIDQLLDWCN